MSDMTEREKFLASLPSGNWKVKFANPEGFGNDFMAIREQILSCGLTLKEYIKRGTTEDKTKDYNWRTYKAGFKIKYKDSELISYDGNSQTTMQKAFRQIRVKARSQFKTILKGAKKFFDLQQDGV